MRSNVNILTAASESNVVQSNTGYENSTAAHVAGDLGAHNQVLFYGIPFAEFGTGHTINWLVKVLYPINSMIQLNTLIITYC